MSIRTLIEINHDKTYSFDAALIEVLASYLRSGDNNRYAGALERYGIRVISSRHHSTTYHIPPGVDGFITDKPKKR